MTMTLDENQQKAVEHFEGPALVVAGPGSGKTTVIKERILYLIREHNVDPEQILAIAFTTAAVKEIEERILGELNSNRGYPKIRTLHGFGKDIITDNCRQAGLVFHLLSGAVKLNRSLNRKGSDLKEMQLTQ